MIESNDAFDAIFDDFKIQIIIAKVYIRHLETIEKIVFDFVDSDFIDIHNENVVHV